MKNKGYPIEGLKINGLQVYKINIWNYLDDLALYKNIYRKPNENNINFRNRILKDTYYNSTKQGLINWLSDSLEVEKYIVQSKKIFISLNNPLSYQAYKKVFLDGSKYFSPRVFIDDNEIVFPNDIFLNNEYHETEGYYYDFEKTEVYFNDLIITLWKNIDQTYFPIWEINKPVNKILLKYQIISENNELVIISETPKKLSRDTSGNVIYE